MFTPEEQQQQLRMFTPEEQQIQQPRYQQHLHQEMQHQIQLRQQIQHQNNHMQTQQQPLPQMVSTEDDDAREDWVTGARRHA